MLCSKGERRFAILKIIRCEQDMDEAAAWVDGGEALFFHVRL